MAIKRPKASGMLGETNLRKLLRGMSPSLRRGEFVFCTVREANMPRGIDAVGTMREAEGVTLICSRAQAEKHGLRCAGRFRQITLTVNSALDAVGFLAAVSAELARHQIACNVVSGFFHDHLFVPAGAAARAMRVLRRLSAESDPPRR